MTSSTTMKSLYRLPGERDHSSSIVHTHGILSSASSKQTTQDNFISIPRIYEPKESDLVIGIIIVRTPDLFLVDINSSESAILPITSFDEGRLPARNTMNRLSVVFARVIRTDSWTQTELSCQSIDRTKKKSDFGHLNQGHILRCSLALCEKLQHSQLISHFNRIVKSFRIRVTQNGFIWYITDTINSMIAIKKVLYEYEFENNIDILLNLYQTSMNKLQENDDNLIKAKQKPIKIDVVQPIKTDVQIIKKTEQPPASNAVTRLLNQVIKDILVKIIDDIEKNENR
ncbi:unnamed protein product [Adineta steineri]|uniref:Uncharacterized protein n=1 Tax=Adineta steineri TaxID=433720 RepID=A0A814KBF0_9BILA|nr:unnamed protein product [Adineta steineri]CAF4021749.1 unnamed protein product [Adineta steineri]